MKYFKKIIFGLIGLYFLALGVDVFISKSLLKSSLFADELKVWDNIYNNDNEEDVLIFGSSRAEVNINPKILNKYLNISSFNYGYNGQRLPLIDYRIGETLNNIEFKNLVLVLDDFSFQNDYIFKIDQLSPILLFNYKLFEIQKEIGYYDMFDIFVPLKRYFKNKEDFNWGIEVYKKYAYSNIRTYRNLGYRENNKKFTENLGNNINEIIEFDKEVFNLLDTIIKKCKHKNINVIFITAPTYREKLISYSNHNDIINSLKDFSKINNILYIDYSNLFSVNGQEYFADPTHLNVKGANIFTKKLAEDIKPYIKR